MHLFNDTVRRHLDRRDALYYLLAQTPSPPPTYSIAEFETKPPSVQRQLNTQRLSRLGNGLTIPTPEIREVHNEITEALIHARYRTVGQGGLIITGPAGAGKTTAVTAGMRLVHHRYTQQFPDWERDDDIPIVYIEVPPGATGKSTLGRILRFFGIPVADRATIDERMAQVVDLFERFRTRMIVVDELHHLDGKRPGQVESTEILKGLSNAAIGTIFLYSGINLPNTRVLSGALGDQLSSRAPLITLRNYGHGTTEEIRTWRGIVRAFEQQLGLLNHQPGTLADDTEWLWWKSGGRIQALSRMLVSAAQHLIIAGDPLAERLNRDLLDQVKLDYTTETARQDSWEPQTVGGAA